ncbi:MAG: aldose 1-epimerase family protein [bacterium]|nr:aldose 1-epimerase family protein [bacterium]
MPRLFGRRYTKKQLIERVGDMSQLAGARRAELVEGNEQGAGLIEVFNASGLCFSILPGRSLDIASAHYKGMSLCFRGSTGDVGPAFYEPQGYGWMRGFFGGLVTSCGMIFTGHPEVDPEEENEELGLHGRLSFIPAKGVVTDSGWEEENYVVRVRGKMREAVVFGTNLELSREISTVLGEKCLRIHDRIENLSVDRSPLMFVYHTNPGFPLLDANTRLVIHSKKTTEWQEDREVGPEVYEVAKGPQRNAHDDVYVHRPRADAQGNVHVGLINDRLQLGLYWKFPIREIPLVNHWQHFHRGTYVTGIEPGNASMLGRAWNRKHNTLQYIEPGEVREFHLEIGVLDGEREIRRFERQVRQGVQA